MNFQCRMRFLTTVKFVVNSPLSANKCYCNATVPYIEYFPQNCPAKKSKPKKRIIKSRTKDDLDSFAEKLSQRYAYNRESTYFRSIELSSGQNRASSGANFSELKWNENNVNKYLTSALLSSKFVEIQVFLLACYGKKILPDRKLMVIVALKCALKGEVECIKSIQNLCKSVDVKEYENQGQYFVYLAGAMWMKGNIEEAEKLFWTFYCNNQRFHGKIKFILKNAISHALSTKGEAALVISIKFAKKIHEEFQDCTFLIYIWEHCIFSDWFCDNHTALELLEEIPDLQEAATSSIPDLVAAALAKGKVDAAQRLCEILLKYEKKELFCLALRTLFDYSCLQRDERACLAIIESSRELDVPLTEAQHESFLHLFCNDDKKEKISMPSLKWPQKPHVFNLKF